MPSDYKLGIITLPLQRRHWVAIRNINGQYYNLDSKLSTPGIIGSEQDLIAFLRSQLETNDREVFIVVRSENGNQQKWLKEEEKCNENEHND